ncbi:MAG: 50S ribosomal protein L18 [Chloroflexi bacterium]|nr:50S ribosomal protein L18 [Chloroflexota bacterium]
MPRIKTQREARLRRHQRVRKRVLGTATRPRLAVFRSLKHIYAQVIDDTTGRTLSTASSLESEVRSGKDGEKKTGVARSVGHAIAERTKKMGVAEVVFDRGGYQYHGRVKAVADAAREEGLRF